MTNGKKCFAYLSYQGHIKASKCSWSCLLLSWSCLGVEEDDISLAVDVRVKSSVLPLHLWDSYVLQEI